LALAERIVVAGEEVKIVLKSMALASLAGLPQPHTSPLIDLSARCALVRRSREVRLALSPAEGGGRVDPALVKLLVKAHAARTALMTGEGASLAQVAEARGHDPAYFAVLVKLAYLSPDTVERILDGSQPPTLDRQILARARALPMEWTAQSRSLGLVA
jgi:hypothetical protein